MPLVSNTQTFAPRPRRRQSNRLALGVFGAILLVTLPVLPLRFLGIPGPGFTDDLKSMAKVGRAFLTKLTPTKGAEAPQAEIPATVMKADQVKLLAQAEKDLLADIEKEPLDPSLRNRLGLIYAQLGDADEAMGHFQGAVDLARKAISKLTLEQDALAKVGKTEEASRLLLKISQMSVELSAAHSNLARVYDSLGQHDKVVAEFDALSHDVSLGNNFAKRAPANKMGNFGIASASAEVPPTVHKLTPEAMALLARAEALMQARRYPEAIATFKQLLTVDPEVKEAHKQIGLAALYSNNIYVAQEELETALSFNPNDAECHGRLGIIYLGEGQGQLARAEFEKSCQADPGNMEAAMNLGNMLAQEHNFAQAKEVLSKAALKNPNAAALHNNLGSVLSLNGEDEAAIPEFQRAITLSPNMGSAHYGLGVSLYNMKSYPSSIQELKRALILDPNLLDAHNKIEMAYRKSASGGN